MVVSADEEVIVQAHEVIEDDLVVFAPYLRVDGVVQGDLVVLATDVVIDGIVEQDLLFASKTLYLGGSVNDDVRGVTYALAVGEAARVADDFWSAGYSLETKAGSRIGGGLGTASRQALLSGQVTEGVLARAGALAIEGIVGESVVAEVGGLEGVTHSSLVVDVDVEIPEVPPGITIASGAAIGGDLDHHSAEPARIAPDATIAGAVRHEPRGRGPTSAASGSFDEDLFQESGYEGVERLAVLLLVGGLLAMAAPRFLAAQLARIREEPVNLLGWGLGTFIGTAFLSVLAGVFFLTLLTVGATTELGGLAATAVFAGGLTQAALGALFLLAAVYVAPALAAGAIGGAILDRVRSSAADTTPSVPTGLTNVALGAAVYAALRMIPGLGWLIGLVAALVGLGALGIWLRDRLDDGA